MNKMRGLLRGGVTIGVLGAWPWLGGVAHAQAPTGENTTAFNDQVRGPEPVGSRPVVLKGTVFSPDGTPARGAVLVSSAGGKAVADGDGEFQLKVRVPDGVSRLQVTAVGAAGSQGIASQQVNARQPSGTVTLHPLLLSQSGTCRPDWLPTFGSRPGTNEPIRTLAVFDDGNGSALYAGGSFTIAGGTFANRIAKWDGVRWSSVGSGMDAEVRTLTVYDDGSGQALYAGGDFMTAGGVPASHMAKWDGTTWSGLDGGANGSVTAFTSFDDGTGTALYAGGEFTLVGGVAANRVARWTGSSWSPLGSGTSGRVHALEVFDDGTGDGLYVGGTFLSAGGLLTGNLAKWDGSTWSGLGSVTGGAHYGISALTVYDDGNGPALVVGGVFDSAGGVPVKQIAAWDGTNWSTFGGGMPLGGVTSLLTFDDGSGHALFAGGVFPEAGGTPTGGIAKWNGTTWTATGGANSWVYAMAAFDDGGGEEIYFGGAFAWTDGGWYGIARWDGANMNGLGDGLASSVETMTVFDGGGGPALYAAGFHTRVNNDYGPFVRAWNGTTWLPVGGRFAGTITSFISFDDGSGPSLFAAGDFDSVGGLPITDIAQWDGARWQPVGGGLGPQSKVNALAVFDDGGGDELYATGEFFSAGGTTARNIAKWDGSTWEPLGSGLSSTGHSMTVYNDGAGEALIVGGVFSSVGGVPASLIAQWDGANWSPLGSGMTSSVLALTTFDGGNGPELIAAGTFLHAGGSATNRIAKWDGTDWEPLGSGVDGDEVRTLSVFDDGTGPALYAAGKFSAAGGAAAHSIAKWSGARWQPLGPGLSPGWSFARRVANSLVVLPTPSGAHLIVGGEFLVAGRSDDSFIARWGCPH